VNREEHLMKTFPLKDGTTYIQSIDKANEPKGAGVGGESLKEKFIDSASNNKTNTKPMEQLIGGYKEFVIIERTALDELKQRAIELLKVADNDTSKYYEAMAIMDTIKFIKERNIYNREFRFNK
jgi:hypothetical protein